MTEPPMRLTKEELAELEDSIAATEDLGAKVREVFERNSGGEGTFDVSWEVESAVDALEESKSSQHSTSPVKDASTN